MHWKRTLQDLYSVFAIRNLFLCTLFFKTNSKYAMYSKSKMLLQSVDVDPNLLGCFFLPSSRMKPERCCQNLKSCLFVHSCRQYAEDSLRCMMKICDEWSVNLRACIGMMEQTGEDFWRKCKNWNCTVSKSSDITGVKASNYVAERLKLISNSAPSISA